MIIKVPANEFEIYADCIRSDQVSVSDIMHIFKHTPKFKSWYYKKFIKNKKRVKC